MKALIFFGVLITACVAAIIYCYKHGIFLWEVCPADDIYYDLPINPKSL